MRAWGEPQTCRARQYALLTRQTMRGPGLFLGLQLMDELTRLVFLLSCALMQDHECQKWLPATNHTAHVLAGAHLSVSAAWPVDNPETELRLAQTYALRLSNQDDANAVRQTGVLNDGAESR